MLAHGTDSPLCTITASVTAILSPSGTAVKYPQSTEHIFGVLEQFLSNFSDFYNVRHKLFNFKKEIINGNVTSERKVIFPGVVKCENR